MSSNTSSKSAADEVAQDLSTALGGLVLAVSILASSFVIKGLVIVKLWEWFVVPLGQPELYIAWAIGLGMLVSYLTFRSDVTVRDKKSGWEALFAHLGILIVNSLLTLGIGWIVAQFMVGG